MEAFCSTRRIVVPALLISSIIRKISRLVEKEQVGPLDKTPPDGQHLLLPSGQGPGKLGRALGQTRKETEDPLEALLHLFPGRAGIRPHLEVLPDAHVGEDAPTLRDVGDPQPRDPVGRETGDRFPVVHDAPRFGTYDAGERPQDGALPRPVRADESDDLPSPDSEGNIANRLDGPV
ncbi:MAG: hypothetical protein H6Q82_1820, partial [Deltaproteobacteria bacterium]|nr:hypothetical protein [Deltaproteobacteria bacterium]